jgi:DNA-directed RNA polymerase subunit RPC12/RpoP
MVEEKMLLNKCGICGGFLYEHTDLETANRYIYCPKCKEEHDEVKEKMLHDLIKADMVEKVVENG